MYNLLPEYVIVITRTILSCVNDDQLKCAHKMVDNFLDNYAFHPDKILVERHAKALFQLIRQKQELNQKAIHLSRQDEMNAAAVSTVACYQTQNFSQIQNL